MARKAGYPDIALVARNEDDDTLISLQGDSDSGALKVNLYCYNTDSLAWERMRQPQIAPLAEDLPLDTRMEYSSGDLIYKGIHATHDAATSDTAWLIWKYTWSGDDLERIEGPLDGAWDNRASLAWGS